MTAYELAQLLLALPADQQQMQVGYSASTLVEGRIGVSGIHRKKVKARGVVCLDDNDDPALGPAGSHYIELF